jgi:hypothetical protein
MIMDTKLFPDVAYQIKRNKDGMFSRGGQTPIFGKKGKVWSSKAALSLHLNYFDTNERSPYRDSVIIETFLNGDRDPIVNTYSPNEWINEIGSRKEQKKERELDRLKAKVVGYRIINADIYYGDYEHYIGRLYLDVGGKVRTVPCKIRMRDIRDV